MGIQYTKNANILIITIDGHLGAQEAEAMEGDLLRHAESHTGHLLLDLSSCDYLSSMGLRLILKLQKTARLTQHQLAIGAATPEVAQMLEVAAITSIIPLYTNLEEAMEQLK